MEGTENVIVQENFQFLYLIHNQQTVPLCFMTPRQFKYIKHLTPRQFKYIKHFSHLERDVMQWNDGKQYY